MSDTGTVQIRSEVIDFLHRRHGLYIGGEWIDSTSGGSLTIEDPSTGEPISQVVDASPEDVEAAVMSAHECFEAARWRGLLPAARERILLKLADLVEENAEMLAQLETLEQGKSIVAARAFEVASAVNWIRYTAGLATKITGRTMDVSIPFPEGARYMAYTRRAPVGVVAGIVPWNFPFLIGVWKVLPALAAGCSIVIKPSETTPLTMMRLAELATEAGVPPGAFNVVTGNGATAGKALAAHPLVSKISFTGSTPTGKAIAHGAIDRLAHITLELGGKNPAIVLRDADLDETAAGLLAAAFLNQGQVCASCSRIYAEAPIFDALAARLEQAVRSMTIGPGLDLSAQINPLVSRAHRDKVQSYIDDARGRHAEMITGGAPPAGEGFYVSPTLVLNPDNDVKLRRDEVFGPVLSLTRVADAEEAISMANDTELGLAASLWSQSLKAAMDFVPRIAAGTVWVNSHVVIDPNMPFGGVKQSGSGRDFGVDWLDAYTDIKSVCIRH